MRDHESLLLLRGLAFPSAPTVRASRLRGQGQLGGPRLPRRSYTPRHARLDPRARHRDPDRWLNTEARWRARWSAGGRRSQEHDGRGTGGTRGGVRAPRGLPEASAPVCVESHATRAPRSAPCRRPASSKGLWPRRHRGPGRLWPGPPSRARPGPFTPLACAIPGGEVSEKAGYTLLRECSPNVADRFGDLKRNDTAQNQPRRRLRGMNSHVPMASPQHRNKKTLNIVNRILQAAAALRVS